MDSVHGQIEKLKIILTGHIKDPKFYITVICHSAGYRQPSYVTFYLNFWPYVNGAGWVHSESIDERDIFDTDKVVEMVKVQLNTAYSRLKETNGQTQY